FLAISEMLALISSVAVATVCRLRLTSSVAVETALAWAEVSSELALICWLTEENSSLALATFWAVSEIACITLRKFPFMLLMLWLGGRISWLVWTSISWSEWWPAAIWLATSPTLRTGREISRAMNNAIATPSTTTVTRAAMTKRRAELYRSVLC